MHKEYKKGLSQKIMMRELFLYRVEYKELVLRTNFDYVIKELKVMIA